MSKITFTDRDDLLKKLVVKKVDANQEGILSALQKAIKRAKRGDKEATKAVIKLRKNMLRTCAEVYMELEEDDLFTTTVAELNLLEEIEDNN